MPSPGLRSMDDRVSGAIHQASEGLSAVAGAAKRRFWPVVGVVRGLRAVPEQSATGGASPRRSRSWIRKSNNVSAMREALDHARTYKRKVKVRRGASALRMDCWSERRSARPWRCCSHQRPVGVGGSSPTPRRGIRQRAGQAYEPRGEHHERRGQPRAVRSSVEPRLQSGGRPIIPRCSRRTR